jgi:hypothetical protein
MILFLLVSLLAIHAAVPPPERFNLGDPNYVPKTWKLIPRTKVVSPEERVSSLGVTPDDFFSFIPAYVGSVLPGQKDPLKFAGHCFQNNTASVKTDKDGNFVFSLDLENKKDLLCTDGFLIAYIGSFQIQYFEFDGTNDITFSGPFTEEYTFDVNNLGIRIFMFPAGFLMTGTEIYETIMLFFGGLIGAHVPEWTAEQNLQFLQDHMNVTMPERTITEVDLPETMIKSGDFLGVIRLDGLDPMLAWAMGSHTGHTCITIWINNTLYVAESTVNSAYWPTNGIQITPYKTWIQQARDANYNVVHLPLDPKVAAKFNETAAIEFFNSVQGLPYGFHNLFTGWIDTPEDNYPAPLTSHLVQLLAPFAEWLLQKEINIGETYDFITQGFNHRLNTQGLTLDQAYMVSLKKGIDFTTLVTMPEQDSWIFENGAGFKAGPSMVCDVFVTEMWKAGGLFGGLTDQFEAAEFTNWDAYSLNLFDANYVRPTACVVADPDSQFCQILGKYRMALPDYNTVTPFAHMRERCPSEAPNYIKPANC